MGQKINPIGFRLSKYRKWKYNWYLNNQQYTDFLILNFEINKYLTGILRNNVTKIFLINCYIGKITLNKLYVYIFFYRLRRKNNKTKRQKYFKLFAKFNSLEPNYKKKKKFLFIKQNLNELLLKKQDNKIKSKSWLTSNTKPFNLNKRKHFKINKRKIKKIKFKALQTSPYILKKGYYKDLKTIKKSLIELTNSKISLTAINALSFIKVYENLHENLNLYNLRKRIRFERINVERHMTALFRYSVKYIRDVINITIITLILKQPSFLAKFIGYLLYKTPRNYRHGKIIYFLITLIKTLYSNREELLGIRIQFKGRLNGKRRARRNQFLNLGYMPLPTYNSYIEYGESAGLTRYGSIGIKIWFCYNPDFNLIIQKSFLVYFGYKNSFVNNKKNKYFSKSNIKKNKNYNVRTKKNKIQKNKKRSY